MKHGLKIIPAAGLLIVIAAFASGARAGELRDPMRPAGAPAASRPAPVYSLKLEGVIAGGKRVAIVNGRLVRAGDSIAGAKILEVFANGVRYERAGKIQTLMLSTANAGSSVRVARSDKKPEAERP